MKKGNFNVINHPLAMKDLSILRDKNTSPLEFRGALKRVAKILVTNVTSNLKLKKYSVTTPLEKTEGYKLQDEIILVPVLRAGLGFVDSILDLIPEARVGHIGIYRDEETLRPVDYYLKLPHNIKKSKVFIVDPMLATGGSAEAAINFIKEKGAKDISLLCLVAAPEGVRLLSKKHPDVKFYAVSLDRQLNNKGYILPGLGDAGDRIFGTV